MSKNKVLVNEDWTAVILGFLIILLFLAGLILHSPSFGWADVHQFGTKVFSGLNLSRILLQFVFVFVLGIGGIFLTGRPISNFLYGFPFVYLLTIAALLIAGNTHVKAINLEAVIFSLSLGLVVGNAFKLPAWFKASLSTEMFVKIGLVLLGASIIFTDILKAGFLGLVQALAVVISVWYFAFWICKKFKIDDELSLMVSSAVSICGVSAAIATSGAIKGDPKKLSFIISLVLVTAIPMMIVMPYVARFFHFSEEVTGAWLGGSIDTTGAVVASGTLVGETALKISTIVKFSQNVLLGVAAFAISVYWSYRKNDGQQNSEIKPTLKILWERFPKFVIGFVAASLLFSFVLSIETLERVKDPLKHIQGLWFALAFTSIGLETNFRDLISSNSRRPVYAFLIAQTFNIFITLAISFLLFGGIIR